MYEINEISILLTTSCSDNERIQIYEKRVMRWLTDSPFDVYLVDSANTGMKNPEILNHPRYQQLLFNQKAPEHYNKIKCFVSDGKLLNNPDYEHTTYERYSVVLAIRKFHFIGKYKTDIYIHTNYKFSKELLEYILMVYIIRSSFKSTMTRHI